MKGIQITLILSICARFLASFFPLLSFTFYKLLSLAKESDAAPLNKRTFLEMIFQWIFLFHSVQFSFQLITTDIIIKHQKRDNLLVTILTLVTHYQLLFLTLLLLVLALT